MMSGGGRMVRLSERSGSTVSKAERVNSTHMVKIIIVFLDRGKCMVTHNTEGNIKQRNGFNLYGC